MAFSRRHCHEILRRMGARNASWKAANELCNTIEKIALEISKIAVLLADDDARFKVTYEDVRGAVKEFLESQSFENIVESTDRATLLEG